MSDLGTLDFAAVAWLFLCWIGYTLYSERSAAAGNLVGIMHERRIDWMMRMPEPFPAIWSRSDVAISNRGQERSEERSGATVEGRDAAPARKRHVPSGCPPAAIRCVIPLARCASIALRGIPDGLAAGGQQSGSIWPGKALEREIRMVDLQIVNNALNNATFFASTSILILAGLFALMASPQEVIALVGELPFAAQSTAVLWEIKVLLMMLIFVHGFFKFAWAMRQFNYCSLLIGAAPIDAQPPEHHRDYAVAAATVASLAAKHFNHGARSYYFGMAALSWFIHPGALIPAVLAVVLVLWRREFRSRTLKAIKACRIKQ